MSTFQLNGEKYEFYSELSKKLSAELLEEVSDRSTIISETRTDYPFYLYLNWRQVTDKEFLGLAIALGSFPRFDTLLNQRAANSEMVMIEFLKDDVMKLSKRFLRGKISKVIYLIQEHGFESLLTTSGLNLLLPIREYVGNFRFNLKKWLRENLTIRYQTPRRVRRQERQRGYRDHGSLSDTSQKARQKANTMKFDLEQVPRTIEEEDYRKWVELQRRLRRDPNSTNPETWKKKLE